MPTSDVDGGTILPRFTKNDQVRRVPLQAQALEIMRELPQTRRRVGVRVLYGFAERRRQAMSGGTAKALPKTQRLD